jgi:predicted FMN-binding regulatory protein PaiB
MPVKNLFGARSPSDVAALIRDYPLAWLVSGGDGNLLGTQVPLVADLDPDGNVTALIGHFARRNPHLDELQRDGRAMAMFSGPHGYISPSWFRDRTQAPTWNVTTIKVRLNITVDGTTQFVDDALARLVAHMERGRPVAWAVSDMGARYEQLRRGVVGFHGEVLGIDVKLKLGQNERDDVLADQIAGLAANGYVDLANWVKEHNAHRAGASPSLAEAGSATATPPVGN